MYIKKTVHSLSILFGLNLILYVYFYWLSIFIELFLMNFHYFILFCFVKRLFSLYIWLVISSLVLVFIFMFGVVSRLLFFFFCDFMNSANKIKVVTANVDKPSFPSRWSLQLKVYKLFPPGIGVHHESWNQFCLFVFYLFSSSVPRLASGRLVNVTLSLELWSTRLL